MSRLRWLSGPAVLVVVAALAAASMLPARWVMAWTPTGAPLVVTDAQGTIWSARATLAIGVDGLRRSLPEPLHWRVVLTGGPHLVLSHPWLRGVVKLTPSWAGMHVSSQTLQVPAAVLATLHSIFNTLEPGGDLVLQWPDLLVSQGGPIAEPGQRLLLARWLDAGSSLSRIRPLGRYRFSVEAAVGPAYSLRLQTDDGPLRLEGSGTLTPPGRLSFDGRAWSDPAAPDKTQAALRSLLDALGPKAGPDGVTLMRMR